MKKLLRMLSMLTMLAAFALSPAFALSGVYDASNVFSADEEANLSTRVEQLEAQTDGWKFAIVTTDNAEGKTARDYADDRWDASGDADGALVLFDFDNGEVYISCAGDAMALYTDARVESILDEMFVYIPDGAYYDAAVAFIDSAARYYEAGMETDDPIYHLEPGNSIENYADDPEYQYIQPARKKNVLLISGVAVLSGLAAGGIAVGLAMAKYRLKFPDRSYNVAKHAQLELTDRRDDVIGHIVTHRRIPRNDDHGGGDGHPGGGTTIHHSSGGSVHSGGGRRM